MNDNAEVPIRDAATVIILRQKKDSTHVLMGQRGNKAAFMPSKYVFPGGAVDEDDTNVELFKSIDKKSVDYLVDELKVEAIKIPSGEINNFELIDHISKKKVPVILSSGASKIDEITIALNLLKNVNMFW